MNAPSRLSARALDVLRASAIRDRVVTLPRQLDRKLYEEVDTALQRIGGGWKRGSGGHVFPFDPSPLVAEVLESGTLPPKNPNAFFPTPPDVADQVISAAELTGDAALRILEPSAGQGALIECILRAAPDALVDVVEADPWNAELLRRRGWAVRKQDFLTFDPPHKYDRVIMNPPFSLGTDRKAYIAHILHAWSMVAENGILIAIAPTGFTYAKDRRSQDFLRQVNTYGCWSLLPEGAFKASGTGAATVLIEMTRTAAESESWRDKPHDGFSSWHASMTNLVATNDSELYRVANTIREDLRASGLTLNRADPIPSRIERRIRAYFAAAAAAANALGDPVVLRDADMQHLIEHFVNEFRDELEQTGELVPSADADEFQAVNSTGWIEVGACADLPGGSVLTRDSQLALF